MIPPSQTTDTSMKIGEKIINEGSEEELHGVTFDKIRPFKSLVDTLCIKKFQLVMRNFVISQFGYCLLV